MKIGVMSDSHGEVANVREAGAFLAGELNVDLIVHLGDDEEDADALRELGPEVIVIPGVFSERYKDPAVANRARTEFGPWRVLLSHTGEAHKNDLPEDPDPQALVDRREVDLLLHGHTHTPYIASKNGVAIVSPGHLRAWDTKGHDASFACLEVRGRELEVTVYSLAHKSVLLSEVYTKP
jgi:putative phosphoesterase